MAEFTFATLMENVTAVFTSAIDMVGTVADTVTSNPILLAPIVLGLAGIGIAFFKKLR